MNSIHIASVISNLRNSLVWGWGLGGGVVRVVLEAPPLVVAWVNVQPLLPSTVRFFFFFFFCYSILSIGVCGTFVSFCSLCSLIWSDSFLLVHLLCVARGVASQLVSHTLFKGFVEIHSKPYFATPTAGHNS